ncbi:MAG: alpha/beta fold hydrolase [bacterium]
MQLITDAEWAQRCQADGEFMLAARHWHGALSLHIGDQHKALTLVDGQPWAGLQPGVQGVLTFTGAASTWAKVLAAHPERFHHDLMANITMARGLSRPLADEGDGVLHAQYYAAVMRAIELLRPDSAPVVAPAQPTPGSFAEPVGRYIHLNLAGDDYRVYFEEAGQGIPLLLQHTAGCHGSQWRHLFENPQITSRFRLIAYDLPFHGKSLPPQNVPWWTQTYQLKGEFLRSVPLALSAALQLDAPVFMGCSVGGLLALDLAHKHPDAFRAVIAVEGALHIEGSTSALSELWHPQVSNEYKARLMDGLMAPGSPVNLRKETGFVYASGWPPLFLGDLYYYMDEFDLRAVAGDIDTTQTAVHILSGEYDYSGTSELGQAAHAAISGSTWAEMSGVGHFPMSENPATFIEYLLPILDGIA